MYAPQPSQPLPSPETSPVERSVPIASDLAMPDRHLHRERDFGIGYGNSSGYASARHFTDGHADPLFRCR